MSDAPILLARDQELQRLNGFLDRAVQGNGQVCMISGRAGTGKTHLIGEFARRAQERHPDLVVSVGTCDAQSGVVNPYLPFREALNLLLGDVDQRAAQALAGGENLRRISRLTVKAAEILLDAGPDLIGFLVPGGTLLSTVATQAVKMGKSTLNKLDTFKKLEQRLQGPAGVDPTVRSALDQSQIYEQCTNVLCKLAEQQPLILILDDLHWADAASVGLLFRLGRRLHATPILVIGAYRADEISGDGDEERHPLSKTLTEFKRYLGDIWVDLDQTADKTGREFVDAYLDSMPNRLDRTFRENLYRHTGGHPLFTVELIRDLQQHDGLTLDSDGCWVAGRTLTWDALPTRVEGVVEERCGHLPANLREQLTAGSVEGDRFTAEVVSRVSAVEVRSLIRGFSGVAQDEHQLIQAQGVQRIGGNRLSTYAFTSSVIQKYLYGALDTIERSYLHEDVGRALEELYGEQAHTIAVQLAHHFEQADLSDRALHYLRLAGEQAAAAQAHAEAAHFFTRALALEPAQDPPVRYPLLLAREAAYAMLGERGAQSQDLDELLSLALEMGDVQRRAEATLRRAAYEVQTGQYEAALANAQTAADLARQADDAILEAWALFRSGSASWHMGQYRESQGNLDRALSISMSQQAPDLEAAVRYELAVVGYFESRYDFALNHLHLARSLFEGFGSLQGKARCLSLAASIHDLSGDHGIAMRAYGEALNLARQVGWRFAEARFLNQIGENLIQLGLYKNAIETLREAIALSGQIDDYDNLANSLDMCGLAAMFQGELVLARNYFDEAMRLHDVAGDHRGQGFVSTHLGVLQTECEEWEEAVDALHKAWKIRKESKASALMMDTLAGLARLSQCLDDHTAAGEYVDEILAWLADRGVDGIEYPIQVYLICYEVLAALGRSEQAQSVLREGHDLLMERADRLDEDTRTQFLTAVPFNRALHQHWLATQAPAA